MASLKDLRRRIRATKSMQQIFKAMEMVAAAKLRRAQQRALASSPYAEKITAMLANLAGAASELDHPLFKVREVKTTALVVITADRGFAGAYNTNVLRAVEQRLRGIIGRIHEMIGQKRPVEQGVHESQDPRKEAAKFPQRPLVLGDKWDF